ncbi:gamma-glutamylcyclotransferase [Fibrella sp. USSR17]
MNHTETIATLNLRPDIAHINVSALDTLSLSNAEKEVFRAYLPEQTLIIYGTLAPGKPNHSKIAHIIGTWESATVMGRLEKKGWGAALGFNGFNPASPGEPFITIPAQVLRSPMLPQNWTVLDEFEGPGYKRILSAYTLADGGIGIGYIYAINE